MGKVIESNNSRNTGRIIVLIQIKDKTQYVTELGDGDKIADAFILLGGKTDKFMPNINMSKWADEAWLNLNHSATIVSSEKETLIKNVIRLEVENLIHKYYVKDGKLEWEVEFKQKPLSNILEFDLQYSEGLEFYYQPELTPWGTIRPKEEEHIIDSYAIYHNQKNNKYKTGKFCHWFRNKITDANGKWSWVDKFEIKNGKAKIYLPFEFMETAKYPVVLDPNLGYSTQGAASWGNTANDISACHDTSDASGGNTVEIHAYCKNTDASNSEPLKMAIYDDDAGNNRPEDQLLAETTITVAASYDGEKKAAYVVTLAASTKYWIAFMVDSGELELYYDSDVANRHCYQSLGSFDLPANWGNVGTNNTTRWSIWADYAAVGGVSPTANLYGPLYGTLAGVI